MWLYRCRTFVGETVAAAIAASRKDQEALKELDIIPTPQALQLAHMRCVSLASSNSHSGHSSCGGWLRWLWWLADCGGWLCGGCVGFKLFSSWMRQCCMLCVLW